MDKKTLEQLKERIKDDLFESIQLGLADDFEFDDKIETYVIKNFPDYLSERALNRLQVAYQDGNDESAMLMIWTLFDQIIEQILQAYKEGKTIQVKPVNSDESPWMDVPEIESPFWKNTEDDLTNQCPFSFSDMKHGIKPGQEEWVQQQDPAKNKRNRV